MRSASKKGVQERQDDRQHHGNEYRAGDRDIEAEIVALDHDVAGQVAKADLADQPPEQADDDQDDSRYDKNSGHDRRMAPGFRAINGRDSGLLVINGCAKPAMS